MSIGLPLPSRQAKVVDPSTLEMLPPGEVGELVVTSKHSMKEYLNKPRRLRLLLCRSTDKSITEPAIS